MPDELNDYIPMTLDEIMTLRDECNEKTFSAIIMLIVWQANSGRGFTERSLRRKSELDIEDWNKVKNEVLSHFKQDDKGRWFHEETQKRIDAIQRNKPGSVIQEMRSLNDSSNVQSFREADLPEISNKGELPFVRSEPIAIDLSAPAKNAPYPSRYVNQPASLRDNINEIGKFLLSQSGLNQKQSAVMMGKFYKQYNEGFVAEAINKAHKANASDPLSYIQSVLSNWPTKEEEKLDKFKQKKKSKSEKTRMEASPENMGISHARAEKIRKMNKSQAGMKFDFTKSGK